jgi:A/G-specific adenine glycosylase
MELGATVCTPSSPRCDPCPVRTLCASAGRPEPGKYPAPDPKKARKKLQFAALIVRDGDAVLVVRRGDEGLFGGLWELPTAPIEHGEVPASTARALARSLGGKRIAVRHIGSVSQVLTHRDVDVQLFAARSTGLTVPAEARWVRADELSGLGLSSLAVKTLRAGGVEVPNARPPRRGKN